MELADIIAGTSVALKIIQQRLVVILCLLLTFALFGWAMWLQTTLGAIIAAVWGCTIFLPVLFAGSRGSRGVSQASEDADTSPPGG